MRTKYLIRAFLLHVRDNTVDQKGLHCFGRVNSDSQLVIMDEWTSNSLSCEDAKRLLQGGYLMLPQKHQAAKRVNLKCGFFITTNVLPDFGAEVDQEAVYARLKVFTRPLRKKDCSVTGMLRVVF